MTDQKGIKDDSKVFGLNNYQLEIRSCYQLRWERFCVSQIFSSSVLDRLGLRCLLDNRWNDKETTQAFDLDGALEVKIKRIAAKL